MKKVTRWDYTPDYFKLLELRYLDEDLYSQKRIRDFIGMIKPEENEHILDLGCGIGVAGLECAKKGSNVLGIDFSIDGLRIASKLRKKLGLIERVNLVLGTVETLPVKSNRFNKIAAIDLVEHLYPYQFELMLKECNRVLKPEGEIFIYTPNPRRTPLFQWMIGLLQKFLILRRNSTKSAQESLSESKKRMIEEHNKKYEKTFHVDLKDLQTIVKGLKKAGFKVEGRKATRIPLEKLSSKLPFIKFRLGGHLCISAKKKTEPWRK